MSIKLIFDVGGSRDTIKVQIKNTILIDFTLAVGGLHIILKYSLRPEWDQDTPNVLFLQGSNTEFDNDFVEIPRKNLKFFLFAIWKYNSTLEASLEEDLSWINIHKFKCKHCSGIKSVTQFDQINFEYCLTCKDDLKICADCGRLGAEHLFGGECFCNNCVCKNSYCQMCEQEHKVTRRLDAVDFSDYHGGSKHLNSCMDCYGTDIELGAELIYTYKPKIFNFMDYDFKKEKYTVFNTPLNNVLYMGTEIEAVFYEKKHVNVVLGKILKLNEGCAHELIYAKHDGTICDPGSEIVTHPLTLNMFRHISWEKLFDNIIKPVTFGIGGHIHLNKTAFVSSLHVYKFCKFVRTNIKYIEWVAERPLQNDWCKAYSNNGKATRVAKNYINNHNQDRYEMINFTEDTIELRFFWSPSNTEMLLKNVEFVDALYNYTRDVKLHFDYQEFETYIHKHSVAYPYLYNFMLGRGVDISFTTNSEIAQLYTKDTTEEACCSLSCDPESSYVCDWCGEDILEDEENEYDGSYYHDHCYSEMLADRADSEEED